MATITRLSWTVEDWCEAVASARYDGPRTARPLAASLRDASTHNLTPAQVAWLLTQLRMVLGASSEEY